MTALMIASRNGHVVVLDTLLKHGASVDYKKEVYTYTSSLYSEREGGSLRDLFLLFLSYTTS